MLKILELYFKTFVMKLLQCKQNTLLIIGKKGIEHVNIEVGFITLQNELNRRSAQT
jgi:hypothetical protein